MRALYTGKGQSLTTHAPITSFADLGLPIELVDTLNAEGLTTPFPVQAAAIPDALAGRDLLGRGRTGSGKTLAFGLPLLARTAQAVPGRATPRKPHAVILAPTRELALQVCDALRPYAKELRLWLAPIVGGASYDRQFRALDRGAHVVVATPGRLSDLVERGAIDLSEVRITVLDEADQMADTGFLPAVCELLDMVDPDGQRMLFSATLDNRVQEVVDRYLVDPIEHATDPAEASVPDMEHHVIKVAPRDKARMINEIAARKGRTVMFVRSRMGADNVADRLIERGLGAAALHGGMSQGARNRTLAAFKDGHTPVLVATDVAARGIHVDGIDLVLHIDPAGDHKDYLHRAGRTARAGSSGLVLTLALPHQVKPVQRMLRDAGLSVRPLDARPGDDLLAEVFGARDPEEAAAEHAVAEEARREAERAARQSGGRSYGRRSYGDRGDRGVRVARTATGSSATGRAARSTTVTTAHLVAPSTTATAGRAATSTAVRAARSTTVTTAHRVAPSTTGPRAVPSTTGPRAAVSTSAARVAPLVSARAASVRAAMATVASSATAPAAPVRTVETTSVARPATPAKA